MEVRILGELLIQSLLSLQRPFFIETMDIVDFIDCTLIASSNTDLLLFCTTFAVCLFLIELLQLFSELIRGLLLKLATATLIIFKFLVGGLKMLFVILSILGLLGFDVPLILSYFLCRGD